MAFAAAAAAAATTTYQTYIPLPSGSGKTFDFRFLFSLDLVNVAISFLGLCLDQEFVEGKENVKNCEGKSVYFLFHQKIQIQTLDPNTGLQIFAVCTWVLAKLGLGRIFLQLRF